MSEVDQNQAQPSKEQKNMSFRLARRKAIEFAAATLENDSFDVIWGSNLTDALFEDAEYNVMLDKAHKSAVASIRRLLK